MTFSGTSKSCGHAPVESCIILIEVSTHGNTSTKTEVRTVSDIITVVVSFKTADVFQANTDDMATGIDYHTHGRRSREYGGLPSEFGAGEIVPPDFVMLQNFKHQITCITM